MMTRRTIVLVVLGAVLLAGCLGGPGTGTPTAEPSPTGDDGGAGVSSDEIPGIADGSLTNATALVGANEETLSAVGATVAVREDGTERAAEYTISVGADGETTAVTGTRPGSDSATVTIDIWSNGTVTYLRTQTDGDTSYRALDTRPRSFESLDATLGEYLAAGDFAVVDNSTDSGLVLRADEFASLDDGGVLADATSLDGHLVVGEGGRIHNLTVTGQADGQTVTSRYELRETGLDRVTRPDWVAAVPASATLQPELTVDIVDGSYLAVSNEGGDPVPADARLSLSTDGVTRTAVFESALDPGETRYAYLATTDGSLGLVAEQPDSGAVDPVTSPVSVTVTTDGNVTLHSGSMAWSSATASAPAR
jgi:hypothetical protein